MPQIATQDVTLESATVGSPPSLRCYSRWDSARSWSPGTRVRRASRSRRTLRDQLRQLRLGTLLEAGAARPAAPPARVGDLTRCRARRARAAHPRQGCAPCPHDAATHRQRDRGERRRAADGGRFPAATPRPGPAADRTARAAPGRARMSRRQGQARAQDGGRPAGAGSPGSAGSGAHTGARTPERLRWPATPRHSTRPTSRGIYGREAPFVTEVASGSRGTATVAVPRIDLQALIVAVM